MPCNQAMEYFRRVSSTSLRPDCLPTLFWQFINIVCGIPYILEPYQQITHLEKREKYMANENKLLSMKQVWRD